MIEMIEISRIEKIEIIKNIENREDWNECEYMNIYFNENMWRLRIYRI
jgi:hypothetical protein